MIQLVPFFLGEQADLLPGLTARLSETFGVPVEQIMAATQSARHKLVILDACGDNPMDDICPNLKGKKLLFTKIEASALRSLLLVTSAPRCSRRGQSVSLL